MLLAPTSGEAQHGDRANRRSAVILVVVGRVMTRFHSQPAQFSVTSAEGVPGCSCAGRALLQPDQDHNVNVEAVVLHRERGTSCGMAPLEAMAAFPPGRALAPKGWGCRDSSGSM